MNSSNAIQRLEHSEEQAARYSKKDTKGSFFWEMFRKAGSNSNRSNRPSMYYPFYLDKSSNSLRLPLGYYDSSLESFCIIDEPTPNEIEIFPIKDDGSEGCWYFGYERAKQNEDEFKAELIPDNTYRIYYRRRPNSGVQPTTNWFDSKYSATEHGTALLKALFGEQEVFSYPKSIYAVEDCLTVMGAADKNNAYVLDYFAGSGTTGHAVININRKDQGHRKYLLVEQGDYFDEVTKPRIQKVIYSADWKDGKATAPETGISHAFKVLKIESYEDTLNNLQLRRNEAQQSLLDKLPQSAKEDYLLRYLLDIESRGSVLSVEQFNQPFDCKLKVAVDSAGAYEERSIDLVETFNYLIGLRVKHIDMQRDKGFVLVTGKLPTGEKTLVLWRDVEKVDYKTLNRLCDKLAINHADSEFEIVYINGDHNIPAVFTSTEAEGGITKTLKIRQIEPEFLSRMFSVEDV
jgi:adenine-specific DNA-methyltransferase